MEGLSRLEVQTCRQRDGGSSMCSEAAREHGDANDVTGKHIDSVAGWVWRLLVQERKYEVTEVARAVVSIYPGQKCRETTYSSLVFWVKIMNKKRRGSWRRD